MESHREEPDWNDWPSIVRWAAGLDPESQPAKILARGAPVGPPLGADVSPDDVRRGPRLVPPADALLTVVSGYLDDPRRLVGLGDRLYASATYAFAHRDHWTDREHRDYWRSHLHLWPARKGRGGNRQSLAFAIVNAQLLEVPVDAFIAELGYSRDDLRDRHILDLAERMRSELDAGPAGVRVPQVVTERELDTFPLLTADTTLDAQEGAANVKVGPGAREVVLRGAAVAAAVRAKTRPDTDGG